jgi:hypothetical protein
MKPAWRTRVILYFKISLDRDWPGLNMVLHISADGTFRELAFPLSHITAEIDSTSLKPLQEYKGMR